MFVVCRYKPGLSVRIIEDCRKNVDVSGQIGVMLGELPRSVYLVNCGEVTDYEMPYEAYINGDASMSYILKEGGQELTSPVKDLFALADEHTDLKSDSYAVIRYNPCIELQDGTRIWGDECWWEVCDKNKSLEESKSDLRKFKNAIAIYLMAYELDENKLDDSDDS